MSPDTLTGPLGRILLRYLSGALITWGLAAPGAGPDILADPDLQAVLTIAIGAIIAAGTEWAYGRAKATGGPT